MAQQRFSVEMNQRNRRLQLMRYAAHQLGAQTVGAGLTRDVAQDQHDSCGWRILKAVGILVVPRQRRVLRLTQHRNWVPLQGRYHAKAA